MSSYTCKNNLPGYPWSGWIEIHGQEEENLLTIAPSKRWHPKAAKAKKVYTDNVSFIENIAKINRQKWLNQSHIQSPIPCPFTVFTLSRCLCYSVLHHYLLLFTAVPQPLLLTGHLQYQNVACRVHGSHYPNFKTVLKPSKLSSKCPPFCSGTPRTGCSRAPPNPTSQAFHFWNNPFPKLHISILPLFKRLTPDGSWL